MSQPYRLAGVIGWPVAHSRSPVLHGHWLKRHGIDGAYVRLAVRPDHEQPGDLRRAIHGLAALGFAGANVTVPYKEAVIAHLDHVDAAARRLGSVNTLIVRPGGDIAGLSTDGYGFIENLKASAPQWKPDAGPAIILGAGGSARAITAALIEEGVADITLVNRTPARADAIVQAMAGWPGAGRLNAAPWDRLGGLLGEARLLVNTTTLGMAGQPALEIDLDPLPGQAIVADIVYVPLETPLLAAARARGLAAVDGLGMLLHQARPGFAAWFGVEPVVDDDLRAAVLATLAS